ncbi:MAG: type II toxin-antitoxin system mRNA interferase toxin, RelE/StbE family [Patescibacteria group bacterium]
MPAERKIGKIEYGTKFLRSLDKLPIDIQRKAGAREEIFKANAFDPRLDTHKLHGKDVDKWAYSVDYDYRIKFVFLKDDTILYVDIGTHDEMYR